MILDQEGSPGVKKQQKTAFLLQQQIYSSKEATRSKTVFCYFFLRIVTSEISFTRCAPSHLLHASHEQRVSQGTAFYPG